MKAGVNHTYGPEGNINLSFPTTAKATGSGGGRGLDIFKWTKRRPRFYCWAVDVLSWFCLLKYYTVFGMVVIL